MAPVLYQINDVRLNMRTCVCVSVYTIDACEYQIRIAGLRNENKTAKDTFWCFCSQTYMTDIPRKTVLCNFKSSLKILIKSMTFDHTKLTFDDLSCKIHVKNTPFPKDCKLLYIFVSSLGVFKLLSCCSDTISIGVESYLCNFFSFQGLYHLCCQQW